MSLAAAKILVRLRRSNSLPPKRSPAECGELLYAFTRFVSDAERLLREVGASDFRALMRAPRYSYPVRCWFVVRHTKNSKAREWGVVCSRFDRVFDY